MNGYGLVLRIDRKQSGRISNDTGCSALAGAPLTPNTKNKYSMARSYSCDKHRVLVISIFSRNWQFGT